MSKSITMDVKSKKINKEGILKFVNLFFGEYSKDKKNSRVTFKLYCEGGIEFKIENSNKGIEDYLNSKKIYKIAMSYSKHFTGDESLSLSLTHGKPYLNEVSISGNEKWVNNLFVKVNEIIDFLPPQNNFLLKNRRLIFHFISLNIGFLILSIISFFIDPTPNANLSNGVLFLRAILNEFLILKYLIILILAWISGLGITWFWFDEIFRIWPDIEFDFGPEHKKREKLFRNQLTKIILVIIVPFIINLIFLCITLFFF
jgi:hypothetical protein